MKCSVEIAESVAQHMQHAVEAEECDWDGGESVEEFCNKWSDDVIFFAPVHVAGDTVVVMMMMMVMVGHIFSFFEIKTSTKNTVSKTRLILLQISFLQNLISQNIIIFHLKKKTRNKNIKIFVFKTVKKLLFLFVFTTHSL